MDNKQKNQTILIELDAECRQEHYDRAASWFKNVQFTQASFRQLLEDTVDKVEEPHIKDYLYTMLEQAREHEQKVESLFAVIGQKPASIRTIMGEFLGKSREAWADLLAFAGGAKGPWQDLQQLYISNLNSMSAFAVAEQLGLALGIPEILDITFEVVKEKSSAQLLLQECALEMCSKSILYKQPF